jgi:hypothetical protein
MATVKYNGKGPQERINDRLRNSGGDYAGYEHVMANVHHETYPNRVHHNIHHSSSQHKHGSDAKSEMVLRGSKKGM